MSGLPEHSKFPWLFNGREVHNEEGRVIAIAHRYEDGECIARLPDELLSLQKTLWVLLNAAPKGGLTQRLIVDIIEEELGKEETERIGNLHQTLKSRN